MKEVIKGLKRLDSDLDEKSKFLKDKAEIFNVLQTKKEGTVTEEELDMVHTLAIMSHPHSLSIKAVVESLIGVKMNMESFYKYLENNIPPNERTELVSYLSVSDEKLTKDSLKSIGKAFNEKKD
jgi:Ca2+-binding EF-hand superfamily protein